MVYFFFNVSISCSLQVKGFEHLKEVAESTNPDAAYLIPFAQYNVGRAFYEGFGCKQSDKEAERWFLAAAQDGEPIGSIKAQTVLGLFYSRPNEESFDLQKVGFSLITLSADPTMKSQITTAAANYNYISWNC